MDFGREGGRLTRRRSRHPCPLTASYAAAERDGASCCALGWKSGSWGSRTAATIRQASRTAEALRNPRANLEGFRAERSTRLCARAS